MKRNLTLGIIPIRNLRTHPVRTIILLLLALAQAACVFAGLTMMQNMRQEMSLAEARLGADILIYPSAAMSKISSKTLLMQGSPVEVWKDRSMLERMKDCEGIEKVSHQLYIRDTTQDPPVWIAGFDPASDFVLAPWAQEYDTANLPDGAVLAGCKVSEGLDEVTLFGRAWPVAARLMKTDSGLDEMVFVNLNTMALLISAAENAGVTSYSSLDPQNDFTVTLVKVQNNEDLDSITSWLNVYVRRVTAVRSEETLADTAAGIQGQIGLIAAIAAAAFFVLLLALAIAQSMMMKERRKELYLWHVVGAGRSIINRIMLKEALLIYCAGAVLGVLIAGIVLHFFLQTSFSGLFALLTIGLSILAGCISTMIAVRRAAKSLNGQMLLTV